MDAFGRARQVRDRWKAQRTEFESSKNAMLHNNPAASDAERLRLSVQVGGLLADKNEEAEAIITQLFELVAQMEIDANAGKSQLRKTERALKVLHNTLEENKFEQAAASSNEVDPKLKTENAKLKAEVDKLRGWLSDLELQHTEQTKRNREMDLKLRLEIERSQTLENEVHEERHALSAQLASLKKKVPAKKHTLRVSELEWENQQLVVTVRELSAQMDQYWQHKRDVSFDGGSAVCRTHPSVCAWSL